MWSRVFWRDALERAVKTFAQAALAVMVPILMLDGASWKDVPAAASLGAFAGLISVAMSALSRLRGDPSSASAMKPLDE